MKMLAPVLSLSFAVGLHAASPETAAQAVNGLGLDLLRQMPEKGNLCISPFSIQSALAMAYLGSAGATQEEMSRVLHFPKKKSSLSESFSALNHSLDEARQNSAKYVAEQRRHNKSCTAMELQVASRLFGQSGYEFRSDFVEGAEEHFGASLQLMDFIRRHSAARRDINVWVAKQTKGHIQDLIPEGGVNPDSRLVVANALYFKAEWRVKFFPENTQKSLFKIDGRRSKDVPMMLRLLRVPYYQGDGFKAVTMDYDAGDLVFLLILPDSSKSTAGVARSLTHDVLRRCTQAKEHFVLLKMPKFKIVPNTLALSDVLKKIGLSSTLDEPQGSANFSEMAPRKPNDYLRISEVYHQTYLSLDEKGTEAAAATAAVNFPGGSGESEFIEFTADRPFLFAIQHARSGSCLFLGRLSDPR